MNGCMGLSLMSLVVEILTTTWFTRSAKSANEGGPWAPGLAKVVAVPPAVTRACMSTQPITIQQNFAILDCGSRWFIELLSESRDDPSWGSSLS